MKICNWNASFAFRPAHVNSRFEGGHRDVHVRRIGRDAMFARAENGQATIYSGDGCAARAGLTLIAWHRSVTEVHATRSLQ